MTFARPGGHEGRKPPPGGQKPGRKEKTMSYRYPTKAEREKTAMGRFEVMCETYINGNQKQKETILYMLEEGERQTFLTGCGLYHMFTDQRFYDSVQKSVGEQIYNECHERA